MWFKVNHLVGVIFYTLWYISLANTTKCCMHMLIWLTLKVPWDLIWIERDQSKSHYCELHTDKMHFNKFQMLYHTLHKCSCRIGVGEIYTKSCWQDDWGWRAQNASVCQTIWVACGREDVRCGLWTDGLLLHMFNGQGSGLEGKQTVHVLTCHLAFCASCLIFEVSCFLVFTLDRLFLVNWSFA